MNPYVNLLNSLRQAAHEGTLLQDLDIYLKVTHKFHCCFWCEPGELRADTVKILSDLGFSPAGISLLPRHKSKEEFAQAVRDILDARREAERTE